MSAFCLPSSKLKGADLANHANIGNTSANGSQQYLFGHVRKIYFEGNPLISPVAAEKGPSSTIDQANGSRDAGDSPHGQIDTHNQEAKPILGLNRKLRTKRGKRVAIAIVLLSILIIVAVASAVPLTRHHGTKSKAESTASAGAPAGTPTPAETSPNPAAPTLSPASNTARERSIAAISYFVGSVNHTNLYTSDDAGRIYEATSSTDNTIWSWTDIGFTARYGTSIATAVSRPGFPLEKTLIYMDSEYLIHSIIFEDATKKWEAGNLADQGYTAMANSSLAVMYNQCRHCANTTIIAFQDQSAIVKTANSTATSWDLTILDGLYQTIYSLSGTGLALCPQYIAGQADQINLYHQKKDGNISLAAWTPVYGNVSLGWMWALNQYSTEVYPAGTKIAAASSWSNTSTGAETWTQVLLSSSSGIHIGSWSGASYLWLQWNMRPSAMMNSTGAEKLYGDVALAAAGDGFGIPFQDDETNKIEHWLLKSDMVDWSPVGNVSLAPIGVV